MRFPSPATSSTDVHATPDIISAALRELTPTSLAFSHLPPAPPRLNPGGDIHSYPALKRAVWSATNEGEEGELGIALPPECVVKVVPVIDLTAEKKEKVKDEWEQITIVIEYEVLRPGVGIAVVGPDEANPSVSFAIPPRNLVVLTQ